MENNIGFQPDLGVSGWVGILPRRDTYPPLQQDIDADYCIVGAGFTGLAAARRIQQMDSSASVVVLEADGISEGPAGRNSGFMIDLPHDLSSSSYAGQEDSDRRDIQLNRNAIAFMREMVSDYELADEAFRQEGKVNAIAGKTGLKATDAYARHLQKIGEPFERLNAKDMQALTGSDYYSGGLWTPGCAMIQPAMLVQGFAKGLTRNSTCRLYGNSAVESLQKQSDHWRLTTPCGSVTAGKVILAVNGFVERFGFYRRRLMHINLYASMTRELTAAEVSDLGGNCRWGLTPANPFGSTVRRISDTGGHRILIRNRFSYDPSLRADSKNLQKAGSDHRQSFRARFPMLEGVEMEYLWSGRLCVSRNHVWALGKIEDNLYSACCQNGLGATRGVIAGVVAAEMAAEYNGESLMPEYRRQELPKKLLPEPFMTAGARLYLDVREKLAGRDK